MIYGCQIWGQINNTHTEKIFKLQNRALRIIQFSGLQDEVDPLYKTMKILKLDDHTYRIAYLYMIILTIHYLIVSKTILQK